MTWLVAVLLASATFSVGLRTTSLFVGPRVHQVARLLLALVTGSVIVAAILQACSSYRVFDFGLGLMLSLSPVGPYDLAKWWFAWRRRLN